MKRLMPGSLITFLQNNPNTTKADCFAIALPTGTVMYATEGQWDITFKSGTPGWAGAQTTFKALQYGRWSRGPIVSEASFKCNANTMSLSCITGPSTAYPGLNMGLLSAALNRLFDGATVWVYTAYMPQGGYGDVSAGVETKWQGTIMRKSGLFRGKVDFDCADPMYLLNMKVPSRLLQSGCPWSFTDANCGLPASDYTVNFTAASGSAPSVLVPTVAFSQAADYFDQGVVKCLTGQNAGLSQTVKLHSGGVLLFMHPFILPITPGDTFSVIKGCNKTLSMCAATVKASGVTLDNTANFGGTPFTPPPSSVL